MFINTFERVYENPVFGYETPQPVKICVRKILKKKSVDNPMIPQRVLALLRAGAQRVTIGGSEYRFSDSEEYIRIGRNVTEKVERIRTLPEIERVIETIEQSRGKELDLDQLEKLPAFRGVYYRDTNQERIEQYYVGLKRNKMHHLHLFGLSSTAHLPFDTEIARFS